MAKARQFWGRIRGVAKATKSSSDLILVKRQKMQIRHRNELLNPAMPESASTRFQSSSAGSRAICLKHAPERFTIFPIYLPCQNIFGPIHRSQLAHAICIRVVLTYEKHST